MLLRRVIFLWVFGLGFASEALYAQPAPQKPEEIKQAKELFYDAEAFFRIGDWRSALEDFSRSYQLFADPRALFYMAQCQQQLGQYNEALQNYKDFLQLAGATLEERERQAVESKISEVEALLSQGKGSSSRELTPLDNNAQIPTDTTWHLLTPSPNRRAFAPLFFASALTAAGSVTTGLFALRAADTLDIATQDAQVTQQDLDRTKSRATFLATSSDLLAITAVACGVVGFFKWRSQHRENTPKASPTPAALEPQL